MGRNTSTVEMPLVRTVIVDELFEEEADRDVDRARARRCPIIAAECEGKPVQILIDSGSEVSAVSEQFYFKLKSEHSNLPEFPILKTYVVGADRKKSHPITKQIFVTISHGVFQFDATCLVIKNLAYELILGVDFLRELQVCIDFKENVLRFEPPYLLPFTGENNELIADEFRINNLNRDEVRESITHSIDRNHCLTAAENSALRDMLFNNFEIFLRPTEPIKDFLFRIQVTDRSPFKCRNYPVPFALRTEVDKTISDMIAEGIIKRASTPYINPLVIVRKKDGGVRICLDARRLNQVTVPDHDSVVPIDVTLGKFHGAKYFSAIDFVSSYWQIAIHPDDQKFTGFLYDGLSYVWCRTPFGLRNSGAYFIRCLDQKYCPSLINGLIAYLTRARAYLLLKYISERSHQPIFLF